MIKPRGATSITSGDTRGNSLQNARGTGVQGKQSLQISNEYMIPAVKKRVTIFNANSGGIKSGNTTTAAA